MSKVALCMIVKNERRIITRCLDSVKSFVDFVYIEDTGSDDGTQTVVQDWLRNNDKQGEVVDYPWQDFAHNRSHALASLRQRTGIDYALIMDADDIFVTLPGFDAGSLKASLSNDLYDLEVRCGNLVFSRPHLISNRKNFVYRGVIHEFLVVPDDAPAKGRLPDVYIDARTEGARSLDPLKYSRDAAVLRKALAEESDAFMRSRYCFYLAQSLRDAGDRDEAVERYLQRADMGFWDEERYVSLLSAGRMLASCADPDVSRIEDIFSRAIALKPDRVEAAAEFARFLRGQNRFSLAVALLKPLLGKVPPAGLFVEPVAYSVVVWDEYAVSAYWSGQYSESLRACLQILKLESIPPDLKIRVIANAEFALARL